MRILVLLLFLSCGSVLSKEPSKANTDPFQLYTEVMSGSRSIKSLTPEEQQHFMLIHGLLANSCSRLQGACKAACDASSQLEDAANELARCAKRRDFGDDCGRYAREVRYAAENYESAVSDADDECD